MAKKGWIRVYRTIEPLFYILWLDLDERIFYIYIEYQPAYGMSIKIIGFLVSGICSFSFLVLDVHIISIHQSLKQLILAVHPIYHDINY